MHRLVVIGVRLGIGVGLRRAVVLVGELVDRTQRERRDIERLVVIERRENALVQVQGRGIVLMPAEVRARGAISFS